MKYFYTDPLAAAWMAKHFGMKFVVPNLVMPPSYMLWLRDYEMVCNPDNYTADREVKFYIHPDSVKLLEPRRDDIATQEDRFNGGSSIGFIVFDEKTLAQPGTKIIQRNGIAFMWPEVEC